LLDEIEFASGVSEIPTACTAIKSQENLNQATVWDGESEDLPRRPLPVLPQAVVQCRQLGRYLNSMRRNLHGRFHRAVLHNCHGGPPTEGSE
jgi:hypothetical protein